MIDRTRAAWWMLAAGAALHAVAAAGRLGLLWPRPALLDFAGYYTAAWLLGQGQSPYTFPPEQIARLRAEQGLWFEPMPLVSPPVWAGLLVPWSRLDYPTAAWLWLGLSLGVVAWSAVALADLAGYRAPWQRILVFLLVLVFGPTFLAFTLGQNALLLVPAALLIGRALRPGADLRTGMLASLAWLLAIAAKLYPVLWLPALALLGRWRWFAATLGAMVLLVVAALAVQPEAGADFARTLPRRLNSFIQPESTDDQSLPGWLARVAYAGSNRAEVPVPITVAVIAGDPIRASAIQLAGFAAVLVLAGLAAGLIWRYGRADPERSPEGALYLWILVCLLALPHMLRYNHVLLLPPMAWLWRRGGGMPLVAATAYALVALARYNYLWLMHLPPPIGPALSGATVLAVLLLGGGIAWQLKAIDRHHK